VSWERNCGPIPEAVCVLHKCDVRCCVNPNHLFLGTNADNVADKVKKGRQYCGARHKSAKLTPDKVRAIRLDARSLGVIGADYGISGVSVFKIKHSLSWKSVT
jgi:HNH endonuclease